MSSTDDPQTRSNHTPNTDERLTQKLIVIMSEERDRNELERDEQALFREWLKGQLKVMQDNIRLLVEDGRVRNERLVLVESRLDELACSPVHDNGGRENCGA